jgi:predicted dehydrogenase
VSISVALIGTGGIALANHLPGISRCRGAAVTALCDANPSVLIEASRASGITRTWIDPDALIRESGADAVIIATPNRWHYPIAMAAIGAGMHVLCEKPIAMTLEQALNMAAAADRAGVRHMTAFTYRFVPAMRYMHRLVREGFVGEPWHFRAQRFQDWGRRFLAWRQRAVDAGTGEIGDMLSHRIDYGLLLIGPIARVMASTRRVWDSRVDADGVEHPSDLEDWVACIAEFETGATGVLESTKLATACGEGPRSRDRVEVNGADGSLIYELEHPHRLVGGCRGGRLEEMPVPHDLLSFGGGPPPPDVDPQQAFRWDQDAEFVAAIQEGRPCIPSFHDGARVQAVIEAIVSAAASRQSVDVTRLAPV